MITLNLYQLLFVGRDSCSWDVGQTNQCSVRFFYVFSLRLHSHSLGTQKTGNETINGMVI